MYNTNLCMDDGNVTHKTSTYVDKDTIHWFQIQVLNFETSS